MEVVDSHATMISKKLYCGPPGLSVRNLSIIRSMELQEEDKTRNFYYTHKGRCGIGLLCQHWKLKVGDEVLMPAYNCGTEVDPFVYYGLKIRFYQVNRYAKADIADLLNRVNENTRVIYVIHYFGWPQDVKQLSRFCAENNIYLIEDCALSLYSNPIEHPIGVRGDAAIYSFPKTLPVPDGGALMLYSEKLNPIPAQSPSVRVIFQKMLPLLKRLMLRFSNRIGIFRFLPQRLVQSRRSTEPSLTPAGLPEMPQSYYYEKNIQNMTASALTRYIVKHTCSESVVQRRRANYTQLYDAIKESSLFKPLYGELPEGVCPLYLPVLVENRKAVCESLNHKDISAIQWWAGFHRAFDWAEFPEARYLKDHLLALPIHQQLRIKHTKYMGQQMLRVAENFQG